MPSPAKLKPSGCFIALLAVIFGGIAFSLWPIWSAWIMESLPRYRLDNLRNLSSAEVIQRLGPPSLYPRQINPPVTQPNWRSEVDDGPLILFYEAPGKVGGIVITFRQDRVVDAQPVNR